MVKKALSLQTLALDVDFGLETLEWLFHVSALPLLGGRQHRGQSSLSAVRILGLSLLAGLLDDLKQVWLDLQSSDLLLFLRLLSPSLANLPDHPLKEGWVKSIDDCEEPVTRNELLGLLIVREVPPHVRNRVDLLQHVFDGNAVKLVDVYVGNVGIKEVGLLPLSLIHI